MSAHWNKAGDEVVDEENCYECHKDDGTVERLHDESCTVCGQAMWFLEAPAVVPAMCIGCEKAYAQGYEKGAENMREEAAKLVYELWNNGHASVEFSEAVRSLPLQEVKSNDD